MEKKIIAIDIGGTSIKIALVGTNGEIFEKWSIPTNISDNGEHIPAEIINSLTEKLDDLNISEEDISGVGIGVPGPIKDGIVKRAVNLGWQNFPLASLMENSLRVPVTLLNDANAAALGEKWQGSAETFNDVIFITIGTGVGGGVIIDGKILNGANSSGGEIGHIPVKSVEHRICGCGNTNCLECYSSASGMIQTINQKLAANNKAMVKEAKEIFDMLRHKNDEAQETLEETTEYLAQAIAGIINTVDPQEIVIGGGVSEAGEVFLTPLKKKIDRYVFPQIRGNYIFRRATQGNDAGILGAAYQVIQNSNFP